MKNTFLGAIVVALGLGATVPFVGWAQDQPQAQTEPRREGRGFGRPGALAARVDLVDGWAARSRSGKSCGI